MVRHITRHASRRAGHEADKTAAASRLLGTHDEPFPTSSRASGFEILLGDLRASAGLSYALTGSFAADRLASYAPTRLAMLYVDDPADAVAKLGLRAVDAGANVLFAGTDYDVVFDRLVEADGLRFVAPSQAAVDLLTAPGRGPAEGQALLDWMQTHELDWRR